MTGHRVRPIAIQGADVEIDAPGPKIRRFDELLGAFPGALGGPARTTIHVQVSLSAESRTGYDLFIDGAPLVRDVPWGRIEDTIFFRLNRWLLSHDLEHVHLHSGGVSRSGWGVLIVGPSGSGKSTLTAHLLRRGWEYHSDEAIGVTPTGELRAYPRPLSLKPGSFSMFVEVPSVARAVAHGGNRPRVHVPPGELRVGAPPADPVPPGLVVVLAPRDDAGADDDADERAVTPAIEWLRPEECVGHLVANSMDLLRMGVPGVRALVHVARRARAIQIGRADLEATEALVDAALSGPHHDLTVEELAPVSGPEPHRAAGVHTWVIGGDGAVVFREAPGEVLALDHHALSIWRRLDGRQALAEISRVVADATGTESDFVQTDVDRFVEQLLRRGLIEMSPTGC